MLQRSNDLRNVFGAAVTGAVVRVYTVTGAPASIYADEAGATSIPGGVINVGGSGVYGWWGPPGQYVERITAPGYIEKLRHVPLTEDESMELVIATGGTTPISLSDRFGDRLHIEDFADRVTGSGATEDWGPAIRYAHDTTPSSTGRVLEVGDRNYRIASNVPINKLFGFMGKAWSDQTPLVDAAGSWFLIDDPGFTPFTISGLASNSFFCQNVVFAQAHPAPTSPGWAPTDYPYIFDFTDSGQGYSFDNVYLYGINKFIDCDLTARGRIGRVSGQVFRNFWRGDRNYDVNHMPGPFHFWPFWAVQWLDDADAFARVMAWHKAHTDYFQFAKCDSIQMGSGFAFAGRYLFRYSNFGNGNPSKHQFTEWNTDQVVESVFFDDTVGAVSVVGGSLFSGSDSWPGGIGAAAEPGGCAIHFGLTSGNRLHLDHLEHWSADKEVIKFDFAGGNVVTIGHFFDFDGDKSGTGSGAVNIGSTSNGNVVQIAHYRSSAGPSGLEPGRPLMSGGVDSTILRPLQTNYLPDCDLEIRAGWGRTGGAGAVNPNITVVGTPNDISLDISAKGEGTINAHAGGSITLESTNGIIALNAPGGVRLGAVDVFVDPDDGSGNRIINLDDDDYIKYNVTTNRYEFVVGGVAAFAIDANGLIANLAAMGNYANDAAAAAGGIAIGRVYRNGSVLMVRVT